MVTVRVVGEEVFASICTAGGVARADHPGGTVASRPKVTFGHTAQSSFRRVKAIVVSAPGRAIGAGAAESPGGSASHPGTTWQSPSTHVCAVHGSLWSR